MRRTVRLRMTTVTDDRIFSFEVKYFTVSSCHHICAFPEWYNGQRQMTSVTYLDSYLSLFLPLPPIDGRYVRVVETYLLTSLNDCHRQQRFVSGQLFFFCHTDTGSNSYTNSHKHSHYSHTNSYTNSDTDTHTNCFARNHRNTHINSYIRSHTKS